MRVHHRYYTKALGVTELLTPVPGWSSTTSAAAVATELAKLAVAAAKTPLTWIWAAKSPLGFFAPANLTAASTWYPTLATATSWEALRTALGKVTPKALLSRDVQVVVNAVKAMLSKYDVAVATARSRRFEEPPKPLTIPYQPAITTPVTRPKPQVEVVGADALVPQTVVEETVAAPTETQDLAIWDGVSALTQAHVNWMLRGLGELLRTSGSLPTYKVPEFALGFFERIRQAIMAGKPAEVTQASWDALRAAFDQGAVLLGLPKLSSSTSKWLLIGGVGVLGLIVLSRR